jgi:hypothetical protein
MKRLAVCFTAILFIGCAFEPRQEFLSIVKKLDIATPSTIEKIIDELDNYAEKGLRVKEGEALLAVIPKINVKREYDYQDTQTDLLRVLDGLKDPGIVLSLKTASSLIGSNALPVMVQVLSKIRDKAAVELIFSILDRNDRPKTLMLQGWQDDAFLHEIVFPRLLNYLKVKDYSYEVLLVTLSYLEKKKIRGEMLDRFSGDLHAIYTDAEKRIKTLALDRSRKNWQYDEKYSWPREDLSLLLDVIGYAGDPALEADLRASEQNPDPRIAFFALSPRIRARKTPDVSRLDFIASDPQMRKWLFKIMSENGLSKLFPTNYISQALLAESDMVNWLIYPTELGAAPDEIELAERIREKDEGLGTVEYFVFKFRTFPPHWAAKDGWMAGVSGPFIVDEYPTMDSYGDTFSNFETWEGKTPKEHLADIKDSVSGVKK